MRVILIFTLLSLSQLRTTSLCFRNRLRSYGEGRGRFDIGLCFLETSGILRLMVGRHLILDWAQRTLFLWLLVSFRLLPPVVLKQWLVFLCCFSLSTVWCILFICCWSESAPSWKTSLSFIWDCERFPRLLWIGSLTTTCVDWLVGGGARFRIVVSLVFPQSFAEAFLAPSSFFEWLEGWELGLLQLHIWEDTLKSKRSIPLFTLGYPTDIYALRHVRIFVFPILTSFSHQISQPFVYFSWSADWLWFLLPCFWVEDDLLLTLSSNTGRSCLRMHLHTRLRFSILDQRVVIIIVFGKPKLSERSFNHVWMYKPHCFSWVCPLLSFSRTNFFRDIICGLSLLVLVPTGDKVSTGS